jgi:hypothetical protein
MIGAAMLGSKRGDFPKGHNSHTGEVFQRGADMLPHGNMTLSGPQGTGKMRVGEGL